MLFIKASEFVKAMNKDYSQWQCFESHCLRKHGENKSRAAQFENILSNRYKDEEIERSETLNNVMSQLISPKSANDSGKLFGRKGPTFKEYQTDKHIPDIKQQRIKLVGYQSVAHVEEEVSNS